MNSKRGSSAVFLSVILAALMTITLALIYGVREETIRSRTDSIVNLAGDSILSEFDSYVQEEYGLFLIRGNDQELSGKLRKYILYTTGSMEDMDSKLNAMLNDPAAMARIIQMAQQLSGGAAQASPPPPPPPQGAPPPPADGGFDPMLLARFLPLLQDLRQSNSQTTQLLYALRPFLKEEKQPKVERAAKLAHLICIGKRFLTEGGLDIV